MNDVEWLEDFTLDALPAFFKDLTVLSVPVLNGEAFGLFQIESLASGIPTVQPSLGAFPEIARTTNGGLIYSPNTSQALADACVELFSQPARLKQLSIDGRKAILDTFNTEFITSQMIGVYEKVINKL